MKIGVIGGGSIGLLVGFYLSKEHDVTMYVRRKEQMDGLNEFGIALKENEKMRHISAALSTTLGDEEIMIVCVKQLHIDSVRSALDNIKNNTPIIFLQNGMGHIEHIDQLKQPIILGTVEHGALKINDYIVSHTGKGSIRLAAYKGISEVELDRLQKALHKPSFSVHIEEDWYAMLANKLVVNAVINPITALFRVKNKVILRNPYLQYLAEEICKETAAVLQLDFTEAWKRVQHVANITGKNTSSMLKDILENRQTEIEGITGFILQKNTALQLPYSTFIYYSVKAMEEIEGT